uniref:Cyclic AMP response element-binding protein B n=1 Tax=Ascaris suum TaxID=6253 RepID=F1LBB9_ASCSU
MSLQPSVIHNPSTSGAQQVSPQSDEIISEDEARRRREQLNRRPSYRMILKDLETVDKQLKKDPDEPNASPVVVQISAQQPQPSNTPHSTVPTNQMAEQRALPSRLDHPSYIAPSGVPNLNVQSNGEVTLNPLSGMHNVGPATMIGQYSPASVAAAAAAAAAVSRGASTPKQFQELGPTAGPSSGSVGGMLPLNADVLGLKTMGGDGQTFATGNHGMSPEWQPGMMSGYNSSPSPLGMAGASRNTADNDDSTRKRQVRLLKNREAAKECRRKKKEYVKCLENRVAVLENQNKALIEELKTLKELYCRKEKTEL